jgi:protein phosphatase
MKTVLYVHGVCDIGCKRLINEDMILINDVIFRDGSMKKKFDIGKRVLIAVADGIGGLDKGEIASEMALNKLKKILERIPDDLSVQELKEVFDVYAQETNSAMSERMGSTIAGLFIYQNKAFRFHAGDSRIYLLRNGGLSRLTTDHSLRESGGNLNAPANIIINSLGGGDSAYIEFAEIEQPFLKGNVFLLCSDGLHDLVSSAMISDMLILSQTERTDAAEKLLKLAKNKGGLDNISIITIKVEEIEV